MSKTIVPQRHNPRRYTSGRLSLKKKKTWIHLFEFVGKDSLLDEAPIKKRNTTKKTRNIFQMSWRTISTKNKTIE